MKKTVICRDVYNNEYEVSVDELELRVGVYAVIIEDGKILLAKQWDGYSLIGGGVEKGETIEEALIREVKEESSLDIMPGEVFYHATTFFKRDKDAPARQSIQLYLTHKKLSGQITDSDKLTEGEKTYTKGIPEWVNLNDIDKIKFRHSVALEEILSHLPNNS